MAVLAVIVLVLGLGRGCIGMLGLDGQSTSHAPSVRPSTIPGLDVRTPSLGWLRYGTWILDPARLDPDFASGFTEAWRIPGLAPGSRVEDSEGGNLIAAELADGSVGLWDMGDNAEEGPVQIWSGPCPQGWALGARSLWCGSTQISVSEDEQGQGSQSAAIDEVSTNATGRLVAQRSSWALFVEGTGSDGRPEGALSVWMVNHSTPLWSSPGPFRNVEQVNSRLLRAQDATSGETVLLEWATGQEVLRGAQDAQVLLAGSGQGVFLIEAEAGRAQFYDAAGASPSAPYEVDAGRPVHLLGSPSVFSEEEFNALVEDGAQAAARGTWNLYQGAQQVNVVLPSAGADCATWTVEGREVDITSLADGSGTCPVTLTLLDGKADDGASVILLQGPSGAQVTTASTKSNAPSSTVAGTVTALYSRLVVANQNGELVGFLPED